MKRILAIVFLFPFMAFSQAQMDLPITWDDTANVDYTVTDFGGNSSSLVVDPMNASNLVLKSDKGGAAQLWAGTTLGSSLGNFGLVNAIPFIAGYTTVTVLVYSPDIGTPVRLKVEDKTNPGISVETEDTTAIANGWDTLYFDFSNEVSGTAAINFSNTYDKMSIFYNFGTDGATAGAKTYYCDRVEYIAPASLPKSQIDLPITWDDTANVDYTVTDFGGNVSMIAADPMNASNLVLQSDKTGGAQLWAGTTLGTGSGFATALPFMAGSTTVKVMVYSPDSGIPVRLKVEDMTNPGISVETEDTVTTANAWEMLSFDFSNEVSGTAAINFANTYDKMSIFYNFGIDGATAGAKTYYCDLVEFDTSGVMAPPKSQIDLPITWDDTANVDYTVTDFGGNASMIAADPMNASNLVLQSDKTGGAQLWAGTTLGTASGFANAIPFSSGNTTVKVLVYSPDAGIPVRLKVEDNTDPTKSVETEDTTSVANAWDTLFFDFSNEVSGTAAINFANTYDKMSIFYNFGTDGATAGAKTYYCDLVEFDSGGATGPMLNSYCNTQVYHLGDPVQVASSIYLTIANQDPTTMKVEIESVDSDTVDFLLVNGGSGATISAQDLSVPGKISRTLTWVSPPSTVTLNILWSKNSFGGNWQLSPMDVMVAFTDTCGPVAIPKSQIDLPITWDDTANVDYTVTDFGGNVSMLAADPTNASNVVLQSDKTGGAQLWAGTTLGTSNGFSNPVPFSPGNTLVKVMVYSPDAGIPVRLKVEDHTNATISVETEDTVAVANAWNTLVFDFSNQVSGTPAINFSNTYDKMSIFYNFGTDGATAGAKTYFCDLVEFDTGAVVNTPKAQIDLPITWDDTANVDYTVTDFGGNVSMLAADPMNASNIVMQSDKTAGAQLWAGTTLSTPMGLASAIPFSAGSTIVKVLVYSPDAGIPVRMKAEDHTDPTKSVETEDTVGVANGWDTLYFDFSNEVSGTAPINFANTYDMISIFYNFGTDGATAGAKTYYADLIEFDSAGGSTGPTKAQIDLPITWDDTANVDYTVTDFGGNVSMLAADPMNASNIVMQSDKTAGAQLWAGTTLSTPMGLATAIPFSSGNTTVKVLVYSPDAGIPVRLKAEDHTDPTKSVETEDTVAVANGWDTLYFDFSNEVSGTAPINFANTYDMISIFYNFGTDGATAGAKTYYADLIEFDSAGGSTGPTKAQIDLPITWDDTANVDYTVTDFGGNVSMLVADPLNASNIVMQSDKTGGAQLWAGTTLSTPMGLASAIPFSPGNTVIKVVVYSPDAGIPVRLKAEDHTNATISVETEDTMAVANAWDTLVFDFSNQVSGTAPINFANTYDMISIFYNFGTDGATAGAKTYYSDLIEFDSSGGSTGPMKAQIDLPITWDDTANVDYTVTDFGGNASLLTVDPLNSSNLVMRSEKTSSAQTWAGTTLSTALGLANAIPFSTGNTSIRVLVYSPDANTPVRLKAEDAANPAISVETEVLTTVANAWDTLLFDFINHVGGTPPLNFANTYDKLSIFYNFGTDGATAGSKTYYCDDITFDSSGGTPPSTYNITFQVDMNQYTGSFTTPEVNGTFNNWCGNCAPMTDANADGIWEITIPITADSIEFKFSHDNWTGQETLTPGSSCTKTAGGFTNRFLVLTQDTVLPAYCWESCATCGGTPPTSNVTFRVDMNKYTGNFTTPEVNGDFNGWCGNCAPMSDPDGDGIWELTIPIAADSIEFKFSHDNWTGEEMLMQGMVCTKTSGGFTNRFLMLSGDTILPAYCWESCMECTNGLDDQNGLSTIEFFPNPTKGVLYISGITELTEETSVKIYDSRGRLVLDQQFNGLDNGQAINLDGIENGMYWVNLRNNNNSVTRKIIMVR